MEKPFKIMLEELNEAKSIIFTAKAKKEIVKLANKLVKMINNTEFDAAEGDVNNIKKYRKALIKQLNIEIKKILNI